MKILVIMASMLLVDTGTIAQIGKLKRADDRYDRISYADAANLYTDLLNSEVDGPTMKAKLADCYYQMGNTRMAEEYYAQMVSTNDAKNEDLYQYAQALKENGKYSESDKWMGKFHARSTKDSRGKQFSENKSYRSTIAAQGTFFKLQLLDINTEHSDFGGYPQGDIAFIVSNRTQRGGIVRMHSWDGAGFLDLYQTTIGSSGSLNSVKYHSKKVNQKYHEGPLCFSKDGKTVYFTRNNMKSGVEGKDDSGIQNLKLFTAQVNEEGKWGNERELSINSRLFSVGHPTLSKDGKTMYFASDMPGGFGGADIYKVSVKADGSLGNPENLGPEVNTEGQEMFPWIGPEETLFFSSDGHVGLGGLDVYAVFPNSFGEHSGRMNIGMPVNSSKDDFAFVLEDNDMGYVSSNREGGKGGDDIYAINLVRPLKLSFSINGVITDGVSKEVIPGARVSLVDKGGNVITSVEADAVGGYNLDIDSREDYFIRVTKEGYFDCQENITTTNMGNGEEKLKKELSLEMVLKPTVKAIIENREDIKIEELNIEINPINFDVGKWDIRSDAKVELDKIVEIMNKYPNMKIELGSHTDCRSSKKFNMSLSEKRAKSSAAYIRSKISNPDRIYGRGYGESRPLNGCKCEGSVKSGCPEEEHAKNRRTEFKVISEEVDGTNGKMVE